MFQNAVTSRRSGVAIFADINKIITRFTKKISKDLRKVKRIRDYVPKKQSISVFLDITKFANFWWKNADISWTQEVCHVIHFFLSSLGKVWLCHVSSLQEMCDRILEGGDLFAPSIREQPQKCPFWIGLTRLPVKFEIPMWSAALVEKCW